MNRTWRVLNGQNKVHDPEYVNSFSIALRVSGRRFREEHSRVTDCDSAPEYSEVPLVLCCDPFDSEQLIQIHLKSKKGRASGLFCSINIY